MKVFKYNLIGLAVILMSLAACETLEVANQDVDPVVSPDGYPVATFESSEPDNTISEGDTLIYTITTNKMQDRAVTFNAELVEGTLTEDDFVVVPGTLEPWSNSAQLMIVLFDDGIPNADKTGKFEITVPGIAEHYLLNPSQVYPTVDLTVKNYNDPTLLTVLMAWEGDSDFDFVVWSDTPDYPMTGWSDQGATTANPESDHSIWLSDPVGTYYISIMDWDGGPFDYTFTIGHPDGSVQTITGTFDKATKTYVNDQWTNWGGSYDSYRVLKVENTGTAFTVTEL
jgi:hypothetical protein